MNFRIGNLFRELWYSLRRSPSLFIGTVGTIFISLTMLGGGLVIDAAVDNATQRWGDGVEFIVFMNPDATPDELEAVSGKLDQNPEIEDFTFFDKQQAFSEFQRIFSDSDISDTVTEADLPPSFRVNPTRADSAVVETLADGFRDDPGVYRVVAAVDTIRDFENFTGGITTFFKGIAIFLLIFALLLVYNTIRMTIFARRREVEVMRLVGASNWYIRLPFMTEGVLQGILGGGFTMVLLWLVNWLLGKVGGDSGFALLETLKATDLQVLGIGLVMTLLGAAIGAVASIVALSRFLDV